MNVLAVRWECFSGSVTRVWTIQIELRKRKKLSLHCVENNKISTHRGKSRPDKFIIDSLSTVNEINMHFNWLNWHEIFRMSFKVVKKGRIVSCWDDLCLINRQSGCQCCLFYVMMYNAIYADTDSIIGFI